MTNLKYFSDNTEKECLIDHKNHTDTCCKLKRKNQSCLYVKNIWASKFIRVEQDLCS